jgi:signal peptidase II
VVPRYYPIFNLADSAIVCGGILMVILAMRGHHLDGTRSGDEPSGEQYRGEQYRDQSAVQGTQAPAAPGPESAEPAAEPAASAEPAES